MTKARIRQMKARAEDNIGNDNPASVAVLAQNLLDCIAEIEHWQTRARAGQELTELAAKVNPTKKARGTRPEVDNYIAERKLDPTDAEWFWEKMTENDWKVGKQPVKDWRGRVRQWQILKIFPSQKVLPGHHAAARPDGPPRMTL